MSHLTLPIYCTTVAAFLLALLLRSAWTGDHFFALMFIVQFAFFGWRAVSETRLHWPAFRAEMQRRTNERARSARLNADDTH